MASVALATKDLLFGSKVESMIREAGFDVVAGGTEGVALVIVDLTEEGVEAEAALREARGAGDAPALAYYAHTDDEVRRAALEAGFDKVVPRSRMMREGVDLISALVAPPR